MSNNIQIMLANPAGRNLIREGKIHQLPNAIRTNTRMGMQLLDYALCNDKEEVEKLIANIEDKMVAASLQIIFSIPIA